MRLRKLLSKDAQWMFEWMHDDDTVRYFKENFSDQSISDCLAFIDASSDETQNVHMAIVNDSDEYMGTVSLKHIHDHTAEFAIVLRKCARGKGYASFGMREILKYGFTEKGIDSVYWCVDPMNLRAVRFYEKHNAVRCDAPEYASGYTEEEKETYIWYRMVR
ncbi:MAG: GNAT family N-acetyltransferase [Lachnospiraceae bacterium]|nr:GNAT family N-acetyltransferase [Lachnospiraceae bacterium]